MKNTYYIIRYRGFRHDDRYDNYEEAVMWARARKNEGAKLIKVEEEEIEY